MFHHPPYRFEQTERRTLGNGKLRSGLTKSRTNRSQREPRHDVPGDFEMSPASMSKSVPAKCEPPSIEHHFHAGEVSGIPELWRPLTVCSTNPRPANPPPLKPFANINGMEDLKNQETSGRPRPPLHTVSSHVPRRIFWSNKPPQAPAGASRRWSRKSDGFRLIM